MIWWTTSATCLSSSWARSAGCRRRSTRAGSVVSLRARARMAASSGGNAASGPSSASTWAAVNPSAASRRGRGPGRTRLDPGGRRCRRSPPGTGGRASPWSRSPGAARSGRRPPGGTGPGGGPTRGACRVSAPHCVSPATDRAADGSARGKIAVRLRHASSARATSAGVSSRGRRDGPAQAGPPGDRFGSSGATRLTASRSSGAVGVRYSRCCSWGIFNAPVQRFMALKLATNRRIWVISESL